MPTAPMWTGARLAAVGIAEGLGASMTLVYGWVGAATQLARRYFRCTESNKPRSERQKRLLFDPAFLVWDFCQKKPSKIKI
jgi:hypothetical protein